MDMRVSMLRNNQPFEVGLGERYLNGMVSIMMLVSNTPTVGRRARTMSSFRGTNEGSKNRSRLAKKLHEKEVGLQLSATVLGMQRSGWSSCRSNILGR